jgi:hypothetical protein
MTVGKLRRNLRDVLALITGAVDPMSFPKIRSGLGFAS